MNLISCGESCRWQCDGMCTLEDISLITCCGKCAYFEQK